ncbi:MAG: large-conductance mechanosensitive channel protein MscL [Phycisphaeraceae bacterium]|nr:large-conductance mechanosensitive channel protein MscL [Phycisphaeraceae bacterium]
MIGNFIKEFREFAVKGNAIDMAVGLVVGAAFNKIVQSIVNDIMMPPLGMAIGGVDFRDLAWVLQAASTDPETGKAIPLVAVRYGAFLNTLIEFIIVAFSAFIAIKAMTRVMSLRGSAAAEPKT